MPSPLLPPTVAVTTTNVSFATKFRMHRSVFLSLGPRAVRSNFRALTEAIKSTKPQMYCSSARGSAIVSVLGVSSWSEQFSVLCVLVRLPVNWILRKGECRMSNQELSALKLTTLGTFRDLSCFDVTLYLLVIRVQVSVQ